MSIVLPAEIEGRFAPEEIQLDLALGMFLDRRVTLGQGAAIARLSQSAFLRELGQRKIAVHYDEADAQADIAMAERWGL